MTTTELPSEHLVETTLDVHNPATGEIVRTLDIDGPDSVNAAVARARAVFPTWRDTPAQGRGDVLIRFAALVRQNMDELVNILAVEGGQVVWEAEFELAFVADTFEFYAGLCRHHAGSSIPSNTATTENIVKKDPLGVIAAVVPWNFPAELWAWKASAALASGNVVIAKPSPETPLSALRLHELLIEAGLPENVHQVLIGGGETGAALVSNPGIDGIAFTGSIPAGKQVLRAAAENITRICTLELSGQDPFIVADDADIDLSAQLAVFGAYLHGGQICVATERIYVAASVYDQFVDRLVHHVEALKLGDPLDPATDLGPQMNAAQVSRVESYIAEALKRGATVRTGGERAPEFGDLYYRPSVITGLSHNQLKEMGEVFGPIAPVVPFDTFEEAIALANDSSMGLGAVVVTSDLERAMTATRDLRFGSVWINAALGDTIGGPFGGFRQSGYGRELGVEGYETYLESKHVTIERKLKPSPWWFGHRPTA